MVGPNIGYWIFLLGYFNLVFHSLLCEQRSILFKRTVPSAKETEELLQIQHSPLAGGVDDTTPLLGVPKADLDTPQHPADPRSKAQDEKKPELHKEGLSAPLDVHQLNSKEIKKNVEPPKERGIPNPKDYQRLSPSRSFGQVIRDWYRHNPSIVATSLRLITRFFHPRKMQEADEKKLKKTEEEIQKAKEALAKLLEKGDEEALKLKAKKKEKLEKAENISKKKEETTADSKTISSDLNIKRPNVQDNNVKQQVPVNIIPNTNKDGLIYPNKIMYGEKLLIFFPEKKKSIGQRLNGWYRKSPSVLARFLRGLVRYFHVRKIEEHKLKKAAEEKEKKAKEEASKAKIIIKVKEFEKTNKTPEDNKATDSKEVTNTKELTDPETKKDQ
ncbi:hypothetical protein BY996DRAFT_6414845 [Phakopsora pachyrhizi]|uniref:Expressed protein n=1 Tax=Phakopsora pachyrhizi TaxID=170000 RepID=A0AAV0BI20_PHAPC|nr:hypothetical protein BY996DRAFT_6414845 [Phakopsora pachyrhizi]CAH7686986.1 expressed protein [Phakopsora pachyrhizi]